jgi:hypothetical protein
MPNMSWWSTEGYIPPGIPLGGILGLDTGYSTPAGYTEYTTNMGKFVLGSSTANSIGGSATIGTQSSDTGDSSHSPGDAWAFIRITTTGGTSTSVRVNAGSHTHIVTVAYTPRKTGLKLIQASADGAIIPVGAILFGRDANLTANDADYTTFNTDAGYFSHESSTAVVAEAGNSSTDTVSFSHTHHTLIASGAAVITTMSASVRNGAAPSAGPAHAHAITSPTYTPIIKHAILKAFKRLSADRIIGSRTIIMFEGESIPVGWTLCDGTGGTLDLTDRFIKFSNSSGLIGTLVNSVNTLAASGTLAAAGSHNHTTGINASNSYADFYSHINDHTHTHSFSLAATSFTPVYRTLKFIQYTG